MAKRNFKMPCLVCGRVSTVGNRCATHQAEVDARARARLELVHNTSTKRDKYKGNYKYQARLVKQQALEQGLNCPLCDLPLASGGPIHADHIYPELGSNSPLQAVHASCNLRKGNRPPTPPNGR